MYTVLYEPYTIFNRNRFHATLRIVSAYILFKENLETTCRSFQNLCENAVTQEEKMKYCSHFDTLA